MLAFKFLAILVVFGAACLVTLTAIQQLVPWWDRRTARYVDWIMAEHQRMFDPLTRSAAKRLVSLAILGPLVVGFSMSGPIVAIVFAFVGTFIPYGMVRFKAWQYIQKLDNQLVEGLILMANALKSGLSLLQAIEIGADELKPPLGNEFGVLLKEIRLGRGMDEALLGLAERLKLPDLEIAVHSIVTLRETGGNLSETFTSVAHTIAERKKVEDKIRTVTSQGVYQGVMLCAMPWVMAGLFYFMDPTYMAPMFRPLGYVVWATVIVLDALGMWMILKVVKIDV